MSVIMGYKIDDKIVMAADKRLSSADGEFVCDDKTKIVIINKSLAVAFSGNLAIQTLFENFLNELDATEDYRVEDVLFNFETLFMSIELNKNKTYAKNILATSGGFIVSGLNKENQYDIYSVSFVKRKLGNTKTDIALFPPSDVEMRKCSDIYIKYFHTDLEKCMQNTIKDISKLSRVVSPSGDIWVHDIKTGISRMEHFN